MACLPTETGTRSKSMAENPYLTHNFQQKMSITTATEIETKH